MNDREKKQIEKKIDNTINSIREDYEDDRDLSCIISGVGIMHVSEHKYAREYLSNKYQIV
jgi:hypothetical protein